MKGNKGKNTKPELLLRSTLHRAGHRYRIHYSKLPGKPDIAFPSKKLAVFVDGCYWHGCPRCYKEPKTNTEFWRKKILKNKERGSNVNKEIILKGWAVIRVWEHEVIKNMNEVISSINSKLDNDIHE
tara:strand:+ start:107 stop:487 length:381 start_codon:yes stop_codon:yes gene_type:complete